MYFLINLDHEIVNKVMIFGYPEDFIIKSLNANDGNYCAATYYLLNSDQNL
jgi:hypothetical protein